MTNSGVLLIDIFDLRKIGRDHVAALVAGTQHMSREPWRGLVDSRDNIKKPAIEWRWGGLQDCLRPEGLSANALMSLIIPQFDGKRGTFLCSCQAARRPEL